MSAEQKLSDPPPPPPDLTKVPNFEALEKWVVQLKGWCEEAHAELQEKQGLETRNAELHSQLEQIEAQAAEDRVRAEDFDNLVEYIGDVRRGIRKGPELFDYMERNGWM